MDQFPAPGRRTPGRRRALSRLTARVGQTPYYAYDRSLVASPGGFYGRALLATVKLHYAMKVQPHAGLVGFVAGLVDGVDVASAGELAVALDAGADPREISFAGPGKQAAELRQAGGRPVFWSISNRFARLKPGPFSDQLGVPARVAVR